MSYPQQPQYQGDPSQRQQQPQFQGDQGQWQQPQYQGDQSQWQQQPQHQGDQWQQPQYQGGQWQQQPPAPMYQQQAPQVVINNVVSASATAFAGGHRSHRKRQSGWAHLFLFLCTAGIGNAIYAWYVIDWNKKHGV